MDKMAYDGYLVRWHATGVKICEYFEDGLTLGSWNLLRRNPMGYAMLSNMRLLTEHGFVTRFLAAAQMIAYAIVGGNPQYLFQTNCKWITLLALPYGIALSFRRREQFKWDHPIKRRNDT